jgi:hypothetical protein
VRVKLVPKTRWAREQLRYHMRSPYMECDERRRLWHVGNATTGINFWVDPHNDPNWEVIY